MEKAERAVNLLEVYSKLQDNIEACEAGHSSCTITDATIQFDSALPPASMARILLEERNRIQVVDSGESPDSAIQRLLTALGGKVQINPNSTVSYGVTDRMFKLFYLDDEPTLFPSDLQVGPYTWGEFHLFWKYLKSLAELRHYVLAVTCTHLGGDTTAYNSGVLFVEIGELKRMRHRVGLRFPPAQEILQSLSYSPDVARDILHQPLIPLNDRCYVTAPLLIYGSNHERNILLIVNKLDAKSGESINTVKEGLMIDELQPLFEARGFHVTSRLRLGHPPNVIGDVDLLVWDDEAIFALAISLKWFYGPDSVYEVREHDSKFRKALDVHRRCLGELEIKKVELARSFGLSPALRDETEVKGIIVSKMARPTELVKDEDIPIVTSSELVACLKDFGLPALYREIKRISEDVLPPDGRNVHKEVRFGECRILFPQFVFDKE